MSLTERPYARYANKPHIVSLCFVWLFLTLTIGLRYQVGGDWNSYLTMLFNARGLSFYEVFLERDPGYVLLNWLSVYTVDSVWPVNTFCGAVFATGLIRFSLIQQRPWLAMAVAVPYLVIVVAMGYSRQGVAIGFSMIAFVSLLRGGSIVRFTLWMVLAAAFHRSALLLLPIAALVSTRGRVWSILWVAAATLALYDLFLSDSIENLRAGYIDRAASSQGAAIRVAMNAVPAGLFLLLRKRFDLTRVEFRFWVVMALLSAASVLFLIFSPSSTAVDRASLYLIPIQLFVFSNIVGVLSRSPRNDLVLVSLVLAYYAAIQFAWLMFSSHAQYWVPYQMHAI